MFYHPGPMRGVAAAWAPGLALPQACEASHFAVSPIFYSFTTIYTIYGSSIVIVPEKSPVLVALKL
jgi:hypothetical protein